MKRANLLQQTFATFKTTDFFISKFNSLLKPLNYLDVIYHLSNALYGIIISSAFGSSTLNYSFLSSSIDQFSSEAFL